MAVVGNFYFSIYLRLMWKFLGLESECGGSICWPNNKIIDKKCKKKLLFVVYKEEQMKDRKGGKLL